MEVFIKHNNTNPLILVIPLLLSSSDFYYFLLGFIKATILTGHSISDKQDPVFTLQSCWVPHWEALHNKEGN